MNKTRPCKVTFRLSAEERAKLDERVRASGKSQQEFLRVAALKKEIICIPPEELRAVYRELRREGNNLNQIAYHMNRGYYGNTEEIYKLIKEMQEIWQLLKCVVRGNR